MRIGLDFDRVLFDTDSFKQELREKFPKYGETYEKAKKDGFYNLEKHAEILNVDEEKLLETIKCCADYLYDDVKQLSRLSDRHEIVIVTRGDPVIQKQKLESSGVLEYVDEYYIVENGDKNVGNIDFLVDDRKVEIEDAGLPGYVFDREEDSLEDVIEKVRDHEA